MHVFTVMLELDIGMYVYINSVILNLVQHNIALSSADDVKLLMKEIAKMVNFNHPNVMTLTGVILVEGGAPLLVMPYMAKGTLLTHVQKNKAQFLFEDKEQTDKVLYFIPSTKCTYIINMYIHIIGESCLQSLV